MEKLKKIVEELKAQPRPVTEQEILNTLREYLQVIILKLMYQSKYGASLSFMGGTALRICYNLKRYSEDLDFTLDAQKKSYDFPKMIEVIERELKLSGFKVGTNVHDEKIVNKAFVSFENFAALFGLRHFRKNQKIHVKIEVDSQAVELKKEERESFFVNRFQEIYPILKHSLPTLFAGKVAAVLTRAYDKGRDYYDLIWYLSRKTELNLDYLNRTLKEARFKNVSEVHAALRQQIKKVNPTIILKDLSPFLEDPKEADWIQHYETLFEQLVGSQN